jgi:hypothetical protein
VQPVRPASASMRPLRRLAGATLCLTASLLLALLLAGAAQAQSDLYLVMRDGASLRRIDPASGATLGSVAMSTDNPLRQIVGANGLATDPTTGELWLLLRFDDNPSGRELAVVDPATGHATIVGNTGEKLSAIAFTADGSLYALSGNGANPPSTLYLLSTGDGHPTELLQLGEGGIGEALAFHPPSGLLYRASGSVVLGGQTVFESIDPETLQRTPIGFSGDAFDEFTALTWSPAAGAFLGTDILPGAMIVGGLYTVTPGGLVTRFGMLGYVAKGLAFVPEPAPGALALAALASLGVLARRRAPLPGAGYSRT